MRILRAIRSVNPVGGGPIEGITRVSAALHDLGHDVELLSLDDPKDPWAKNCPLTVHALGSGGRGYGYKHRYVRWLRDHHTDYDAVIVSGLWQFHSFGVWVALRGKSVPYFVFPHGMLDPWFKRAHPLKHLKKWLYWPLAEYRVLRDARAVLFTCEEERRLARKSFWLYRCNERVVSYGTAAPTGDAEQQREAFLNHFPALRNKRLILFLGRIHPKKGCDVLLRAFHAFLRECGNIRESEKWHLAFAGPDQAGLQREMESEAARFGLIGQLAFTGMLRGDLKWGAFHAAEVFALPSHQENFGIAVAEALACGVPVLISTAVNIWREIVDDGAGWAAAATADSMTTLLRRWAGLDAEERAQMRRRARSCFNRRFEIRGVAASLISVLGERPLTCSGRSPVPDLLQSAKA